MFMCRQHFLVMLASRKKAWNCQAALLIRHAASAGSAKLPVNAHSNMLGTPVAAHPCSYPGHNSDAVMPRHKGHFGGHRGAIDAP